MLVQVHIYLLNLIISLVILTLKIYVLVLGLVVNYRNTQHNTVINIIWGYLLLTVNMYRNSEFRLLMVHLILRWIKLLSLMVPTFPGFYLQDHHIVQNRSWKFSLFVYISNSKREWDKRYRFFPFKNTYQNYFCILPVRIKSHN